MAELLQINPPVFGDFPDNALDAHRDEVGRYVSKQIGSYKPDLVITYDESGSYGHPDHIVVSQIVTSLLKSRFPSVHLWYTSMPEKNDEPTFTSDSNGD